MRNLLKKYLLTIICLYAEYMSFGECYQKRLHTYNDEDVSGSTNEARDAYYRFLYRRMKEDAFRQLSNHRHNVVPTFYSIPGPFEPLPGRSPNADYWPLFPFSSQYSGGLDLDPSTARHIGGDINIPVPSWGILDIYGRFFNRIQDTTATFGYQAAPVNMLGLTKKDFMRLVSDPSMHYNRAAQPLIPIGKVPRAMVPMSCRAPMCNPYVHNYALGIEYDFGGHNGVEGDLDIPIPISKDVAYRFPISGNVYYHNDNLTVTYGQEFGNIDPFYSLFEYQKHLPWLYTEKDQRQKRDVYDHSLTEEQETLSRRWRSDLKSNLWKSGFQKVQKKPKVRTLDKTANIRLVKSKIPVNFQLIHGVNRQLTFNDIFPLRFFEPVYNPFAVLFMPYYNL